MNKPSENDVSNSLKTERCDFSNWLNYFDNFQAELRGSEGTRLNWLEREWQLISEHYGVDLRQGIKYSGKTPLEMLEWCIEGHSYPPPELLQVICAQFRTYMDAKGDLKLENVFFGPPKRGAGNYAKRMRNSFSGLYWDFYVFENSADNKGINKQDLVVQFFESLSESSPDSSEINQESFLTQYNRWNKYQESEAKTQGRTP